MVSVNCQDLEGRHGDQRRGGILGGLRFLAWEAGNESVIPDVEEVCLCFGVFLRCF